MATVCENTQHNPVHVGTPEPLTADERLISGVEKGQIEEVSKALEEGADANGEVGVQSVLHLACEKGNVRIVRVLLDHRADLNAPSSKWNDTPLHRACVRGQANVVRELINRNALLNFRSRNCGMTPLEYAIGSRHPECSRLLVEAGAEVSFVNRSFGSSPLIEACSNGDLKTVELLLDHRANPNQRVKYAPLCAAVHFPKVVSLLLEREANPFCQNSDDLSNGEAGFTALKTAVFWGCAESLEIMLKSAARRHMLDASIVKELLAFAQEKLTSAKENLNRAPQAAIMIERYKAVIEVLQRPWL